MFTGIIGEIGVVRRADSAKGSRLFRISAPKSVKGLRVNDSVAVNGVCLTVTGRSGAAFETTAVEETLAKTTLSRIAAGSRVNLELPVRLNERLGGHLVLGHVDLVGSISGVEKRRGSTMYEIAIPQEYMKYVIPVGSVALDGISLTIAEVKADGFAVSIIPHTTKKTIAGTYKAGDVVNVEFDLVGKYIERMACKKTFPSMEELLGQGF